MINMSFDISKFASSTELAEAAAVAWIEALTAREAARDYSVALSGGRIARDFFLALAHKAGQQQLSLARVHFFWADERCVGPDHAESNYRVAHELLFSPLNIPSNQIHRLKGEAEEGAALRDATDNVLSVVPTDAKGQPQLDLVLLGMGEEGHTASLFPGESAEVMASPLIYRAVTTPKPPPRRITLGYPALAAAKEVWMLASGKGKEAALQEAISEGGNNPFGRVLRMRQRTRIFTDITLG